MADPDATGTTRPSRKTAAHIEWNFRPEAHRWRDDRPIGPNLYPHAAELHAWMRQERSGDSPLFTIEDKGRVGGYTNPYTFDASTLAAIATEVINGAAAFAASAEPVDASRAEITRVRLYNEQALYFSRICEALIKQMLHCTAIVEHNYVPAALGHLLNRDCAGCRDSGHKRHRTSLLGSLAHRYEKCGEYQYCLSKALWDLKGRRDGEAAHAGAPDLHVRSAEDSRAQLKADSLAIGEAFCHILEHLAEIEALMIEELFTAALIWPASFDALNNGERIYPLKSVILQSANDPAPVAGDSTDADREEKP